ncbi:hypothetical protein BDY17DRAFT_317309 [Neohortaea acidophila]|uniref:DNA replication factor Cdt1 C-terminal domain-containing protein n=1 Tax=Neohortaea acidophila TaxID=245834 RepID=A0A6A6PSS7_9PEZI|nr:uncharacterized protein BDY17DRAFT_317309 [Neohortaea acidophila]KAF2482734.1 hypothetical protein BDY17DRAFT_317309 [Neohortaea acidophila]
MAGTRKRKHVSIDENSLHQQDIKAFGTVRKPRQDNDGQKKRKTIHNRQPTPPSSAPAVRKLKRKLQLDDDSDTTPVLPIEGKDEPTADKRSKTKATSVQDTPSKAAAAMFTKLELGVKVEPIPFALGTKKAVSTSPAADETANQDLPEELEALTHLNTAFLAALSFYYAHNGSSSPCEISSLLPVITKHWKKRTVTLDDLRRILAVLNKDDGSFHLQDFGRAGICLTRVQPRGRATKRTASYVDEAELKAEFEVALRQRWNSWLAQTPKENRDATVFLDQLALAEISQHSSVEKAAPLFARGQQRLADIKASQTTSKAEAAHPSNLAKDQAPSLTPQSRGSSLLDRILAKQTLTASLPAGPTRDQLERKAALHRVEDVARVLDLLSAGRARCSFSLQAMHQHLQQKNITPEFVSCVQNGGVACVTITKGGKVGLEELRLRVKNALG